MAKINSPGTLFNLLRKAKTTYQKQAPDPKAEAETRHRKIVEDLKVLRGFARKEESGADLEQPFEMRKLALYKRLKKHYQLLKKERDKDDNKAELSNDRLEKQAQKEEREKLAKVVFVKNGNKAQMVKVTTGIADDSYMEIKSGIKPGDEVISGSYSAISRKLKEGAKVAYDKEVAK